MKALSIKQPWAHAIIHLGKDVENRDWPTTYRGPVLIHTGLKDDVDGYADIKHILETIGGSSQGRGIHRGDLLLGGIVGQAEIVDCVSESDSPWFFGRYGFVLRNVRSLPFHACRGQLGFFVPSPTPASP